MKKKNCQKGFNCSRTCINRDYECSYTFNSPRSADKMTSVIKATAGVETYSKWIQNQSFESIGIFDDSGVLIYSNDGDADNVSIEKPELLKDSTALHNHPKIEYISPDYKPAGYSFSVGDILTASRYDLKESHIITGYGSKYSIRRPEGGWNASLKSQRVLEMRKADVVDKFNREVLNPAKIKYDAGELSRDEFALMIDKVNDSINHELTKNLAEAYGFDYDYNTVN